MPETVEQFAARIKAKYPDYQSVPDRELVERITTKYPEYKNQVDFGSAEQVDVKLDFNPPEEKTLAGFGENLLESGAKFAGDIGQAVVAAPGLISSAVTNPAQVGQAVLEGAKGIPGYLAERYGGPQQILDTLYKDPVGFAADLSTLLSGAGAAAKVGKLGKVAERLSTASKVVDPIAQTGRALRAPTAALGRAVGAPELLYQSALKPSKAGAKGPERAMEVVATGVREEIPVTARGLKKSRDIIKDLQQKIDAEIAAIPQGSEFDPLDAALKAEAETKPKYVGVTQADDHRKIGKTIDTFLEAHDRPKSPAETQIFKKSSYKSLKDKAYEGIQGPDVETEKAIARMAKEKLEEWAPDLERLNAREGDLIGLNKELRKAVSRIRNHQVFGIGTPAMGGLGYSIAGHPGAIALAAIKVALDQPGFKSRLAFAINRAQKLKPSKLTKASTAVRVTERDEP